MLKRLFELKAPPARILFKGGTSLAKVYGVVDRFSEDVDLSFERADLGFGGANDPLNATTKKKQARAVEQLTEAAKATTRDQLQPQLAQAFAESLSSTIGWTLDLATDDSDGTTLLFGYPSALHIASDYIKPMVRLEFGARSDSWPSTAGFVKPYAADAYPAQFKTAACSVIALAAERTFWEKATLLHQWYHAAKPSPSRQSRHYYDLYQLSKSPIAEAALLDVQLLERVAQHKRVFFAQAWAHYELAKPGSLRLVPPKARIKDLETDYRAMGQMIFGQPPAFDEIMHALAKLEERINGA